MPPSFQISSIVLQARLLSVLGQDCTGNQGLAYEGSFIPQTFASDRARFTRFSPPRRPGQMKR
jgi:hypothetical protein